MNKKDYLLLVGILAISLTLKTSPVAAVCAAHMHTEEPHTHEEIEHMLITGKREMEKEMPL